MRATGQHFTRSERESLLTHFEPIRTYRAMSEEKVDHHQDEMNEDIGATAVGWREIRAVLESIEMMRATGLESAKLLLVEKCGSKSLRSTLQCMEDLRDYLGSSLRETILDGRDSGEVVGYIQV